MAGSRHPLLARDSLAHDDLRVRGDDGPFADTGDPEEPCEGAHQRLVRRGQTIEREIIPRLVLAHRTAPAQPAAHANRAVRPTADDVAELARLSVERDAATAAAYIEGVRSRGVSIESVFLELLAPAARHLGELWAADLCDFTEVTLGLCRLQQAMREFAPAFQRDSETPREGRRVLLAPAPGEQHTFGVYMVGEFFRHAGWDVFDGPLDGGGMMLRLVAHEWFAIVGFSVAGETTVGALTACIRDVRRASCNRGVGVMVGGPMIVARPELVGEVGADATAVDAREACAQAEQLLALRPRRD
jgi:methanogenic corrinoid protein MtbC1